MFAELAPYNKVYFSDGIAPQGAEPIRLVLKFKRYVYDKENKKMYQ